MSSTESEAAVRANAYAIAYRLLGDRPASQAAVGIVVERLRAAGRLDSDDWLCAVAAETVGICVGDVAAILLHGSDDTTTSGGVPDEGGDAEDSRERSLRAALRRRLASASEPQRVAAALHHLAGYPLDVVAGFMGRTPDEVAGLSALIAPPPGMSYRVIGDPELVGRPEASRTRRRRVSASTVLSIVLLLALVVAAGRCVGPRPTLGPTTTRPSEVVGPGVASQPSTGCDGTARSAGTFTATVAAAHGQVVVRLAVPPSGAPASAPTPASPTVGDGAAGTPIQPRALLVAVADAGSSAAEFAERSGLERQGLDAGMVVATTASLAAGTGEVAPLPATDLAAAIQQIEAGVCVDRSRVTVTGFGLGGQIATATACHAPELVTVAAPVAGASMTERCALSPAVSLLVQWNADDQVMPPAGGTGTGSASVGGSAMPATAAGRISRDWAAAIGAPSLERTVAPDGTAVERAGATDGAAVMSVLHPSGGHVWTSDTGTAVLAFAAGHARAPA